MSKDKHTQGPWTRAQGFTELAHPEIRIRAGSEILATVHHLGNARTWEYVDNSRLIAAAPDLLAALQAAVEVFNSKEIDPLAAMVTIEKGKAAIQKATP